MGFQLDDLWRVITEIDLPGGRKAYCRTLSDWEVRHRQEMAVVGSKHKRDELKDRKSDAYQTYIAPIQFAQRGDLEETIVALEQREFIRQTFEEIKANYVPYPDEATLEERHEVLEAREKEDKRVEEARRKAMEAKAAQLKKTLAKRKKENLVERCQAAQANALVLNAFVEEFNAMTVSLCCFSDEARKQRLFKSADEVKALNPLILDKLLGAYREIDRVNIEQLQDFFQGREPADNSVDN